MLAAVLGLLLDQVILVCCRRHVILVLLCLLLLRGLSPFEELLRWSP